MLECHFMQAFKKKCIKTSKLKNEIFENQVKRIGLFKKKNSITGQFRF